MKIACIAATDLRTDHRARAHAHVLCAAGHQVTLFGVQARGAEPEEDDGSVVVVRVRLPGWSRERDGGSAWRAARWVRRYERLAAAAAARGPFDAYHAFGCDVAGPVAQVAARTGARFVLDDSGPARLDVVSRRLADLPVGARRGAAEMVVAYLRRGEERLQRSVRAAADLVVAGSDALAADGRARWGGPPPIVVLDTFVRPPRRRSDRLRARLGVYPDERIVVVRDEGPGAAAVARALSILGPHHVLVLLGWTRSAADVMEAARETGAADRVRVLPPAPERELLELCACADAAAIPVPRLDRVARLSLPRSVFQLLAARTPFVAPDLPALGALVRTTGAGLLYPGRSPADPGAVAEALRVIVDDPSLGEACRLGADLALAGELSWKGQSRRLVDAYARLATAV